MNEIYIENIDSTNKYLKENYKSIDNYTFFRAGFQFNGYGRFNRSWESKSKDNLLFSLLLKDIKFLKYAKYISILSGVSLLKTLNHFNIKNVSIKWPNDIYVDDKKIAGILVESRFSENNIDYIIIGIGLNVNQDKFINPNATSMKILLNQNLSINDIKKYLYNELINELENMDITNVLKVLKENNYLYLKDAYAMINNKKEHIKILDINDDFSLKVINDSNEIINLISDEVTFS